MTWIEDARRVVSEHQARRVPVGLPRTKTVLLDATTAGMLVAVYDALSETNRARFASMDLPRAVSVGWKLVR